MLERLDRLTIVNVVDAAYFLTFFRRVSHAFGPAALSGCIVHRAPRPRAVPSGGTRWSIAQPIIRKIEFMAICSSNRVTMRNAGDASNNGSLSGLDAARIAQTAAGLPNNGIAGQWKFVPAQRSYATVPGALTGENSLQIPGSI
jgi:hypothetical protein